MFANMLGSIVYAVIILGVGFWFAKLSSNFVRGILDRQEMDPSLSNFLGNLVNAAVIVFAVIAALNQLGIQTTSMIAVLGAAGLAIGLALKDSLGNFAAGVMILVFRQFKAGDVIEAAGVIGVVETLNVFSTQLRTGDNKTIFVPNGKLIDGNIVNYSAKGTRRLDLVFGVSYDADIAKVKATLQDILDQDERVLDDPAPFIGVLELADNSVNLAVRPWVSNENYWPVYFDLHETVKLRFDQAGIVIPFPQRDVYFHQKEAAKPQTPTRKRKTKATTGTT